MEDAGKAVEVLSSDAQLIVSQVSILCDLFEKILVPHILFTPI